MENTFNFKQTTQKRGVQQTLYYHRQSEFHKSMIYRESLKVVVVVVVGVPYAEPPVGSLRFTPPRSPQPWRGVKHSLEFAPVCPQVLPNLTDEVKPARYEYLEKHLQYLKNQSEDCLYLNIYAPHQPEGKFFFFP
ncbi:hypothetical protein M0802_015629 [Mischocyttarus mexicanus]|nr:hypothetical protein M0802_015629 [Mischocyttarus mexicanus]